MNDAFDVLSLRIASPCTVPWKRMEGGDRVRICGQCDRQVYNLSNMTRDEVRKLLGTFRRGERVCAWLRRHHDGTVITADCPEGLRDRARRWSHWLFITLGAAIGWLMVSLSTAGQPGTDGRPDVQRIPVLGWVPWFFDNHACPAPWLGYAGMLDRRCYEQRPWYLPPPTLRED